jgi:tetratricopeptide (TPR) repeat protein
VALRVSKHDEPGELERRSQLERVLTGKQFKRALKPTEFLRVLFDSDLAGRPIDEYSLGVELFGRRNDWVPMNESIVRENLRRLRNLLEAYYTTDGVEDRINLELHGFKPIFSYNVRSPVERYYRRALRHVSNDPKTAFSLLNSALNIDPSHAGALAAWGETELWRPMYGYDIALPNILAAAEHYARKSLESDAKCWRAHIVMGALRSCRKEWKSATEAFGSALENSPEETRAHPWYAAFLMATNRTDEALQLVKAKANEPSDTPWPQLTYATFLYVGREFQEAKRVLMEAFKEHQEIWLADVMWSCVCLALGRYTSTIPGVGMSSPPRIPEGALVYPALSILCNVNELSSDDSDYPLVKSAMAEVARKKLAGWEPPNDAERRRYIGEFCLSPCQLAIGYMAIGDAELAITLLGQDMERNHPLMVWLHLWPILDPLREHAQFGHLVERMKLPSRL